MAIVLEITSGPLQGKRIPVHMGKPLRFGRSPHADVVLDADPHLSSLHFEVECKENSCHIVDLNSRNGIFVNGNKTSGAILRNNDTISAGNVTLTVRLEEEISLGELSNSSIAGETPQERLLTLLRERLQPLYAVLDAARDAQVLMLLLESGAEYQSLYQGPKGAALARCAPYLVKLPKDSQLVEILVRKGLGKSWGVFLICAADFQEIRRHLRNFLQVSMPDGKKAYFRFYDPRVLRTFLPTCTPQEGSNFLGPIKCYLMEADEPNTLVMFGAKAEGIRKVVVRLSREQEQQEVAAAAPPGLTN